MRVDQIKKLRGENLRKEFENTMARYRRATVRACHMLTYFQRFKNVEDWSDGDSIKETLSFFEKDARKALREAKLEVERIRSEIAAFQERVMELKNERECN